MIGQRVEGKVVLAETKLDHNRVGARWTLRSEVSSLQLQGGEGRRAWDREKSEPIVGVESRHDAARKTRRNQSRVQVAH